MKNSKDRLLRNIDNNTWIELRKISIEMNIPMRELLKFLLEYYKENKTTEAA